MRHIQRLWRQNASFSWVFFFFAWCSSCGGGGASQSQYPSRPPVSDSCPEKKSGTLALQAAPTGLQVSYEKAFENGKDISATASMKAVLSQNCTNCHSGGLFARRPALTTFAQARSAGPQSSASVRSGSMPPSNRSVANNLSRYFDAWVQAGYPETLTFDANGGTPERPKDPGSRTDTTSDDTDADAPDPSSETPPSSQKKKTSPPTDAGCSSKSTT